MSRRMGRKHCKWPLGLFVRVKTNIGVKVGKINKHDRAYGDSAAVDFSPTLVNMDGCGDRYTAFVPFRNMKPLPGQLKPKVPWYKDRVWALRTGRERRE
jgi:hypothetical protein